jgi:hypothetical protein
LQCAVVARTIDTEYYNRLMLLHGAEVRILHPEIQFSDLVIFMVLEAGDCIVMLVKTKWIVGF